MIHPAYLLLFLAVLGITAGFFLFLWLKSRTTLAARTAKFNLQLSALDQTILQAKKQLEATFDSISDGIAVLDADFHITRLNRTYADFADKTISLALGEKCYKILRNLDHQCEECPVSNMKFHDGYSCTIGRNKFQIEVKPTIASGVVHNYIETVRDVTRFENLHAQLRRSERMATIGTMVAGIAHEMNNPLSGISGNSQLMLRNPAKYGLNEKGLSRIQTITNSSERATHIIKDLLNFSNLPHSRFQRVRLKTLFNKAIDVIKEADFEDCRKEIDLPIDDLSVWGNHDQLKEAFSKIILNAFHAIVEKQKVNPGLQGNITLSGASDGNNIIASITDNGCGIPEENTSEIFDPFFTTKDPGAGVGLGLSICHRIMAEHNGSIKMLRLEEGSEVQLIFPRDKQQSF
ncbi:ATP-binding protein [Fibrobacterota bacterium]